MGDVESLLTIEPAKLEPYNHKINGTVLNAIKLYEANGVTLRQLLSDFNAVTTYSDLKKAINPWEYLNKGIKKVPIVCGVSTAEALFNTSAMTLYRQKPIEVIKSIYYRNKRRNDSGLERIFLNSFLGRLSSEQKVMVINPSPFVIEFIEKYRNNNCFVVTDKTLADLYSRQYKEAVFVSMGQAESISDVDVMVVITPQAEEKTIQKMLSLIGLVRADKIYGIIQTRLIDNKESCFWDVLLKEDVTIRDIIMIPTEISNSSPKKKCLVSMVRELETNGLIIRKIEYNASEKCVSEMADKITVTQEALFKAKTINAMWRQAFVSGAERTEESVYSTAELYPFTKEIYISYSIYPEENRFYGKAYYAATKNTQIPMTRGKALTARVEKGLRAATRKEVIEAMEMIPYSISMSKAIMTDITEKYLNEGKSVTLKTLWFCLRESLMKNTSYDDEVMRKLFSENKAISDLYPDRVSGETIRKAISAQLEVGEEVKELKLLRALNIIIDDAIKKRYLFENRILPLLPAAQSRASKRQAEVRQALTKRSFETIEEEKVIKFLHTRYKETSIYLAVAIRLLTGISIKEVCGLLWRDFEYNCITEVYKLSITKFVDNHGKQISHAFEENWEKYRVLPISNTLGTMLLSRKRFLVKMGLDDKTLEDYPIIMARENVSNMLKGYKVEYCKPALVAQKCREVISKAEIPQHMIILPENDNEIETDINSYNGDIFRTNFRDKSLNEAGFGLDELHYYLGLKKPDTFSQHYCDYTNEYVQLIIARKLDRWSAKYLKTSLRQNLKGKVKDFNEMSFEGIEDGVPCVELRVNYNEASHPDPVLIEVASEHGFKVAVTACEQR